MIDADQVADALEELMRYRGSDIGRPAARERLTHVLADALDPYAMARLYVVTRTALGHSTGAPDPHRYCPWCQSEFTDSGFAEHLERAHRAMLEA